MSTPAPAHASLSRDHLPAETWGPASRIAFRLCFLYLGFFCLVTQVLTGLFPIPHLEIPDLATFPPMRQIVFWTAGHIFRYQQPLVYQGSGSGDKVFDWVLAFCLLAFALGATCIWSVADRRRSNYKTLYYWFRVFIRFALAGQLFVYGFVKVIPLQMPFPFLTRLLQPFGHFSPMGVLWSSIGSSPAYERFAGSAELLAGVLLVVPATAMLGALICLMDLTEVFALNMTYDVPVKLFSFHLILTAAFLLLPDRSRLVQFCFRNCTVEPPLASRFFTSRRAHRAATAAQILFAVFLLIGNLYGARKNWTIFGGGAPKSPLYGIWNIDEMTVDGQVRSPLLTDYGRWHRVIFDAPQWTMFQRMDDSFAGFPTNFDEKRSMLTFSRNGDRHSEGQLAVRRQGADRMSLDGRIGPHAVRMQVSRVDLNKFILVTRGFHWIQDYPFNR